MGRKHASGEMTHDYRQEPDRVAIGTIKPGRSKPYVSVYLPIPLLEYYRDRAIERAMSLSRVIVDVLDAEHRSRNRD